MSKSCFIYVLYSKSECIVRYIGVSCNPRKRFACHKFDAKKDQNHKAKWFRKNNDIDFKIIYSGSEKDCYELEEKLIELHREKRKLTNIAVGGVRPPIFSELSKEKQQEVRIKRSKANKGRVHSEEARANMSKAQKGIKPSKESREKMSKSQTGKKLSKETIEKMVKSRTGSKRSEETKAKMRISHSGTKNARAFPIYQYSLENVFIKKWDYSTQVVRELGINKTALSQCVNNHKESAGGYIWKK